MEDKPEEAEESDAEDGLTPEHAFEIQNPKNEDTQLFQDQKDDGFLRPKTRRSALRSKPEVSSSPDLTRPPIALRD